MPAHEVFNQPPAPEDYDLFGTDAALAEAVRREGAGWGLADLAAYGRTLGAADTLAQGMLANRDPPP
jgi:putative acyl-CoA dehydrogenase